MSGAAGDGAGKKVDEGGMSATSGPLTDEPMAQGYADGGVVNRDGVGMKGAVIG